MSAKFLAFSVSVILLAATGCSGGSASGRGVSGWFGGSEAKAAKTGYSAAAGVDVRSGPSVTSKSVGKLSLYEKVEQIDAENGFTKVRARKGSLTGWVPSSKLTARKPSGTSKRAASNADVPQAGETTGDEAAAEAGAGAVTDAAIEAAPESAIEAATSEQASPDVPKADAGGGAAKPVSASPPMGPERPRGVGASVFDPY